MKKGVRFSKTDLDAMITRNPHVSIEGVTVAPHAPPVPAQTARKPRGMNKTEAAYAAILEAQQRRGEIIEWAFEPFRLRYGTKAFYKPDFVAILPGSIININELRELSEASALEIAEVASITKLTLNLSEALVRIVEIKGAHIFDAAKPRFKAAQLRYPWAEFQMIQRRKGEFIRIL